MQGNDDPDVFFAKNDITKWFAAKSKLKICILFKKKKKKQHNNNKFLIGMDRGFKNYAEFL